MLNKSFKIIALKIGDDCSEEYIKVLKPGRFYYFHSNYRIDENGRVVYKEVLPADFYNIDHIQVNVCAVVGKNGAGKSTLMELFFRIINNLAEANGQVRQELTKVEKLDAELIYEAGTFFKVQSNKHGTRIYELHPSKGWSPVKNTKLLLDRFFYTVAVNYSLYAYNPADYNEEGNWLDALFHKNDGYQTPLVLNPFRSNGNIDMNTERHLVHSRLIVNLLRRDNRYGKPFRMLTENRQAVSLELTLNKSKKSTVLYTLPIGKNKQEPVTIEKLKIDRDALLRMLNTIYPFNYFRLDKNKFELVLDYIVYKLVSIAVKYADYAPFFSKDEKRFRPGKQRLFLKALVQDESHIAFKLRQTLNFLRFPYLPLQNQTITLDNLSKKLQRLQIGRKGKADIIAYIPPPVFKAEVLFRVVGNKKQILLGKLSSGEKQMVYSMSSILYHLINLNSIRKTRQRTAFKYVNIVLEEIELYFHPEMQRTYVQFMLESIRRLELSKIKAINICFITHSPFILSDIPETNILFLDENGNAVNVNQLKTFGGNIHELLADGFFLQNGFIGALAKKKIQTIIDYLNNEKANKRKNDCILQQINIIGEPFLRQKLLYMYQAKIKEE